ncbi:exodeoxyribonuclease V subunit alpha [Lysobacter niabensis]|uniref:exodeoxyribonuclease V subunit alpha n=1 Tax=Agrilutibacter niabensis TaxID=380628 RepID=UPI003615146C
MKRQLSLQANAGGRAVDRALAEVLRRLDPATDAQVLQGAELASLAVALGHAALDLQRPQLLVESFDELPQPRPWREALQASRWVATPAAHEAAPGDVPLVLEGDLLYLRRYREYERRLVAGLLRLAARAPSDDGLASLAPLFALLFPDAREGDAQARAAALALLRSLLLVTGGPGTGKTTTIARLLLLLAAQARDAGRVAPRIALAAPTGRAADRMAASLHRSLAQLRAQAGIDAALFDALPQEARTLHRLLGTIPGSTRFRHDATQPLPFDVVVVDEASMVDLPLMCKLVEAVRDGARLILLGDADQLPSVEAGDVLAAIVEASGDGTALPADAATQLQGMLGAPDAMATPTAPLHGHRVHLQRGYRQSHSLQLAPLAEAARRGDADNAISLLREGSLAGVSFHADQNDPLAGGTREALLAPWRELATHGEPHSALALADRTRVLTALRDGPQGAMQLNARIEEALAGTQRDAYFHGRLLLVTENSYRHGLFNGDIGVCLRDDAGAVVAWFEGAGGVRGFHPAALPAHTGAFAMTVHKAQGSEYDTVWLQLPKQDARTLSRELVYTALTRARRAVHLCSSEAVLRAALTRHAQRVSGLAWRLMQ